MSGITFTSKIKNEAALYKNLEDVKQAINSANKKSLKRIAEKTVDRAKQKLIEHNTIKIHPILVYMLITQI